MSETSYNGWPASKTTKTRPLVIGDVPFLPGIRDDDDVYTVFEYVFTQVAARVEKPMRGQCWGFSYRPNVNNPSVLSNHSSATAADYNSARHPNNVEASENFTAAQIAEIHLILAEISELAEVIHWGGDWHHSAGLTPDPMHYELHDHDLAKLARVAARIREDAMALSDDDKKWIEGIVAKTVSTALDAHKLDVGKDAKWSLGTLGKNLLARLDRIEAGQKPMP